MWCRGSHDPWQELESKDPDHATFTNEAEFHTMGCVGSSAKGGDSEFLPLPPPPPLPTHSSYSSYLLQLLCNLLFLYHHGTERWRSFCFGPWVVSSIGFFRNHLVVVFCLLLGFVIFVKTCIVQGSCGSGICLLITGFLGSHLWVDVRFKLLGLHCLWFFFFCFRFCLALCLRLGLVGFIEYFLKAFWKMLNFFSSCWGFF